MKFITHQPINHLLQRTVLCGVFALSAASLWAPLKAAGAVDEHAKGKGGRPSQAKAHHKEPAPKAAEHPKAVARHEAPESKKMPKEAPKVAGPHEGSKAARVAEANKIGRQHETPKFVGFRRPIALRNLEAVAHLSRNHAELKSGH